MKTFIMNALGLSYDQFNLIDSITSFNQTDVQITLKVIPHPCPSCGELTSFIKAYKRKKVSHNILINRDTFIYYNCRRYLCRSCNVSFIEHNPFLMNSKSKISSKTIINILEDLKPYNVTFSYIAKRYNLSVTKVIQIFDEHVQIKRKPLSRCICFDEFYFNRHSNYKYAFMIMDFERKLILDILKSRQYTTLSDYFFNIGLVERNKVEYICIDMYAAYHNIASIYFRNAVVCIDSFHVIKKVNDSLNLVRKRIMKLYRNDDKSLAYRLLKHRYKVLLKNKDAINLHNYKRDYVLGYHATENRVLEELLKIHPDLKQAYQLKNRYLRFNSISEGSYNKQAQEEKLEELIEAMNDSGINEFKECGKTIKNWKSEILNSFVWINGRRISNGPIEGKNNYVKKILSNANGFDNFERARNRIIYSQNLHEKYSLTKHKTSIKTQKKGEKNKI